MKISELIELLEEAQRDNGDVEVKAYARGEYGYVIDGDVVGVTEGGCEQSQTIWIQTEG